jgi:hypothetical protein
MLACNTQAELVVYSVWLTCVLAPASCPGGEGRVYCRDFEYSATMATAKRGKSDVFVVEACPRSVRAVETVSHSLA